MNTHLLPTLLALFVSGAVLAAEIKMDDQSQLTQKATKGAGECYFQPPQEKDLPSNAYGELVQQGRAIFVDTQKHAAEYVGNGMNCTNCHLDQGRKANSAPLWGAYPMYPAYRKKNDKVNSYAERVQGCFQFSMNGTPPAADSHVINALTAYSYWLSTGAPTGQELPGRRIRKSRSRKGDSTSPRASESMPSSARSATGTTARGRKPEMAMCFHRCGERTRSTGVPACTESIPQRPSSRRACRSARAAPSVMPTPGMSRPT